MWRFIIATWAVALLVIALVWHAQGPVPRLDAFVVLLVMAGLSRIGPRNEVTGTISLSIQSVILLAAIVMVGPVGAALVGSVASLSQSRRLPGRALAFNTGMFACVGVVSGVAYQLAGGIDPLAAHGAGAIALSVGLPLMVADIVQCVVNAALVSGIMHFSRGIRFRAQLAILLSGTGAAYIAYGVIALVLVILWMPGHVGPFSAALIFAPLFAAQWALSQYGAEVQAHNRTLNALVAAVETKSPASAGQSAAVADLSGWIAEDLTLHSKDIESARMAGMLHDVGLLALPTALLKPEHSLTVEESRVLRSHADQATSLLRGISFLDPVITGITHHHERVDGTGYPSGLAADEIPVIARIVAVADAYAALITPRTDRPGLGRAEALQVLASHAGTAYDPAVVAALERALTRQPARVSVVASPMASSRSAVAHEEPRELGLRQATAGPESAVLP